MTINIVTETQGNISPKSLNNQKLTINVDAQSVPTTDRLRVPDNLPKDIVDIHSSNSSAKAKDTSFAKQLYTTNGKLVEISYSEENHSSAACIIDIDQQRIAIPQENLPNELKLIQDPYKFHTFLSNVYARTTALSDGTSKLYLDGRIAGGMTTEEKKEITPFPNNYAAIDTNIGYLRQMQNNGSQTLREFLSCVNDLILKKEEKETLLKDLARLELDDLSKDWLTELGLTAKVANKITELQGKKLGVILSDFSTILNENLDGFVSKTVNGAWDRESINSTRVLFESIRIQKCSFEVFVGSISDKIISTNIVEQVGNILRGLNIGESFWLGELGLNKKVNELIQELNTIAAGPVQNPKGNECIISGHCIRLSEVSSLPESIKTVKIFATDTVIIDNDFTRPSTNLIIIAPKWNIIGNRTIDLSGANALEREDEKVQEHTHGLAGLPGGSGGNFLGVAHKINPDSNWNNLTITSKGGKGGKGQDAGVTPNKTGKGTPAFRHGSNNPRREEQEMIDRHSTISGHVNEKGTHWYFKYTNYGEGERGFDGKNGGVGGIGGFGGTVTIIKDVISFDPNNLNITIYNPNDKQTELLKPGERGLNGRGASGGKGQQFGDTFYERFYDPHVLTDRSIWDDAVHTSTDKHGENGNNGTDGTSQLDLKQPIKIELPHNNDYKTNFTTLKKQLTHIKLPHLADNSTFLQNLDKLFLDLKPKEEKKN